MYTENEFTDDFNEFSIDALNESFLLMHKISMDGGYVDSFTIINVRLSYNPYINKVFIRNDENQYITLDNNGDLAYGNNLLEEGLFFER